MSTVLWGIRAGKHDQAKSLFLKTNKIAVGWPGMGDLSRFDNNREAFKAGLRQTHPHMKKGAVPQVGGMLLSFVHEMKVGDCVVFPSKADRQVHIGEIVGDYEYAPDINRDFPNVREVRWLVNRPRVDFSQGALYEIGSIRSLFQVRHYADEFLGFIENPDQAATVELEDEDATVSDVYDNIEETTNDFILKRLSRDLKGYPFEHLVAHVLNLVGYNTRQSPQGGDGGVDIIAHKDELGIEPPIIKVQVKSTDARIPPRDVQAHYGTIESGELGFFVSLGGFSEKARDFARNKANIRLMDGGEFIDLLLKYYEELDAKYKALLPLKKVYVPVPLEESAL